MSRLNLFIIGVFVILISFVHPLQAQDQLGVFFDAEGTTTTITTTSAYSQVSAWVQLVDATASEALTAFEFRMEVHSDGPDPILVWTLPDNALNIQDAPAFMVGLGTPMVIEPRMTLAEVLIIVPEAGQTVWLTLHPLEEPSLLDPPLYGYPVCTPAYATGVDNNLQSLMVIGGCDSNPVASINPDGNPPEIKIGGLPPAIMLTKDAAGKQIEFISLFNQGEVSFSGMASVTGTTPVQFEIDGNYYTSGPVYFQVPVDGHVRITPYYEGGGSIDATIELEVCDQVWSVPVGDPNAGTDCAWSVETLVFGEVEIGQTEVLHVDLTNTGYGTLPIEEYYEIPHFSFQKIQHPGGSLAIGESCTYRVNFLPYEIGDITGTLTIGAQVCSLDLSGICTDGPPLCYVDHNELNFLGFIVDGYPVTRTVIVKNRGGGILEGNAILTDDSGYYQFGNGCGGAFSLASNETKSISVIFNAQEEGTFPAELDLGLSCGTLDIIGDAIILEPNCYISVPTLDFGDVVVGASPQSKYFQIRNTGGGVLEGYISLNDETGAYHLNQLGGGPFYLGPGQQRYVGVVFDPQVAGNYSAEVDLGLACNSVALIGSAEVVPPECVTNVASVEFGDFVIGQAPMNQFLIITNAGGGLLEGTVSLENPEGPFFIRGYPGYSFSLSSGESFYAEVGFSPSTAGDYSAVLDLGTGCPGIPLSGVAVDLDPECELYVTEIVFDQQIVGGYSQNQYLTVKNIGGGLLEGTVALADTTSGFTLQPGTDPSYSLRHMQRKYFSLVFTPENPGSFSTEIDVGSSCGIIPISGEAIVMDPECELVAYGIENGVMTIRPIPVGGTRTHYFGIRNVGGGLLTGEVSLDDSQGAFRIAGSTQYSLHNRQTKYFEIEFSPQEVGYVSAEVNTGDSCTGFTVEAEGEESYADCSSYLFDPDFERVAVGDTMTAHLYIYNSGFIVMDGDLQVDGEGFVLEHPGPFTLEVGQYKREELYFVPQEVGEFSAVVSTGLPLCPGQWNVNGYSVPAGSDQMGFYIDAEGTVNILETDEPKVRQRVYLVLHNPSPEGQLMEWYTSFWGMGSAFVMDDWNSHLAGTFDETSYRKHLILDAPIPFAETMVLADFTVLVTDPNVPSAVNAGYAYYKTISDIGTEVIRIREPVDLEINSSLGSPDKCPVTPVAELSEEKIIVTWPCGPKDFEGFHVYRRVNNDEAEKLTTEPLVFSGEEARFEDTGFPENATEIHYSITSIFKGEESIFGREVTLEMVVQEEEIPTPAQTRLLAIYPNPFNPETNISFAIAQPCRVQIKIYDVGGRLVRSLTDESFEAGRFEETWNGRDDRGRSMPSNLYYARMTAGSVVQMKKMTLLK